MPQLDQLPLVYLSQWFWLAIVLVTIFVVVGLWIVPKVETTIDDRDARIASDLQEAQRLQDEAEASEQAWRERMNAAHAEANEATAKAKAKIAAKVEKQLSKVDAEIGQRLAAAEADLDAASQSALAELQEVAAEATRDIVARLAGAKVSVAAARQAVAGAIANV